MKLSTKILIALGVILTLGLLGVIIYQRHELKTQQTQIEAQVVNQKALSDQLMRSQSQYATSKDLENMIKNNGLPLKEIQSDLDKLHGEIASVNQVVVSSKGIVGSNLPSTNTSGPKNPNPPAQTKCADGTLCPNQDPYSYQKNQQNLNLSENFGNAQVPIGSVGFSAWNEKPWSVNLFPRQYRLVSVVGTDENERQYFYSQVKIKVDGKDYDVAISQAETKQVVPESKFSWWNPRLFLGIDGGLSLGTDPHGEVVPDLNLGIISLGRFKTNPDWSFLQLGIGYGMVGRNVQFVLTPFAYNIANHIPLINNTYLGPSVMLSSDGTFSVMAGLRVGL